MLHFRSLSLLFFNLCDRNFADGIGIRSWNADWNSDKQPASPNISVHIYGRKFIFQDLPGRPLYCKAKYNQIEDILTGIFIGKVICFYTKAATNLKEKKRRSGRKNIDWIRMGSIYVMFTLLLLVFFLGTDVSKVPCFRDSFFYSILSGMVVGVSYNLLTSRLDWPCLLRSSFYNSLFLSVS